MLQMESTKSLKVLGILAALVLLVLAGVWLSDLLKQTADSAAERRAEHHARIEPEREKSQVWQEGFMPWMTAMNTPLVTVLAGALGAFAAITVILLLERSGFLSVPSKS